MTEAAEVKTTRTPIKVANANGAHEPPPGRFDDDVIAGDGEPVETTPVGTPKPSPPPKTEPVKLPTLDTILGAAVEQMQRRHDGREKPIALPWPILAEHFAGGLWPGVHFLNAATGVGKSSLVLQIALGCARAGVPVAYVGLELEALQIAARAIGDQARVPWSKLYTGKLGKESLDRALAAVPALRGLPFHPMMEAPHSLPASALGEIGERLRAQYPETDGPGSRPALLILDFLQIVGSEPNERGDTRERIARAAYQCRRIATTCNVAVLVISAVGRDKLQILARAKDEAKLGWEADPSDCPIKRTIGNPDVLVGVGKESGDIEFSGDSVSVLFRATPWVEGEGCDVVFATPKGRATAATWSPLRFTGFRFEECTDRGGRLLEVWKAQADHRDEERKAKQTAKEQAKADKLDQDAAIVAKYVLAHEGCTVTDARVNSVANNGRRWSPAVTRLGAALRGVNAVGKSSTLKLEIDLLPEEVKRWIR